MQYIHITLSSEEKNTFKQKMLNWIKKFNIFCLLDNNEYNHTDSSFEWIAAVGADNFISINSFSEIDKISSFHQTYPGWLFGHFNYPSSQKDFLEFPAAFFFQPKIIIRSVGNIIQISSDIFSLNGIHDEINAQSNQVIPAIPNNVSVQSRISKKQYLKTIDQLKKHIQRGDCYEINYCMDFFAESAAVDPYYLFYSLSSVSPNPFSAFYKLDDKFCLCASPERFIKKTGNTLFSQPIKGTSKRIPSDTAADLKAKNNLFESPKERTENVMVVDLVRNDMSRVCKPGSVLVNELFGIYSFPQVHHMISTIQGTVSENTSWVKIIEACYPMGSMTGAPKIKVMELIEKYESFPRGLFSGTIGYVSPTGDFDFNVVIRSIIYNSSRQLLSFKAGSGITINSDAEQEYEECLAKASALMKILSND